MNLGILLGLLIGAVLVAWGIVSSGAGHSVVNLHGILIVLGGTSAAIMINCPFRNIVSAFGRIWVIMTRGSRILPTPEDAIAEMVRLANEAAAGGGLLSLQNIGQEFAGGFVHRSVNVAIATGESQQTRRIIERQVKQMRISRQEDGNVFRTIGTLSPMFGILGTLLGMIQVLGNLSNPTKVGPSMALALSSAFLGIAIANFICIPVAGQIRLAAMNETLVLEILLEGVLDIQAGKPPYLVELHLASYSARRRQELAGSEGARAAAGGRT